MQITDIRVRIVHNEEKLKGVASITIDECFVIHDLKIIAGPDQLFIAMPSRRTKDGEFKDIAHPIKSEVREELSKLVLEAYAKALAENSEE
ncbi:MAG: septation regulator SpoVG [Clostridia bacterium]|nr:septation regulator SpoVG [Clostridia bacterium]